MDPKTITAISLLVGFATFLSINSVISNPNFNPAASLKLPDLKSIVLSQIPAGQNSGFSKLLSQKNGVIEKSTPQLVEKPVTTQTPKTAEKITVSLPPPATPPPQTSTNVSTPNINSGTSGNKIEITESQLNQSINLFIPAGTPVQNLVVKLEEGSIKVTGRLLSPIPGDLSAQATVTSAGGKLVIKIQNASVGAMTIPTFLLTSLESAANQVVNSFVQQENGTASIKSAEVQQGKIIITL